jgi:hypothetical protein
MDSKDRFRRQLKSARELSEKLLADFHTPDEWTHQVHPGANHALWFVGHMATTDNFLISLLAPDRATTSETFTSLFGMGSQPTRDIDKYPPVNEVLETMRERRRVLLSILDDLSEEDLAKKTPKGAPDFTPDFASVFELAIWHEGLHSGQLSLVRRSLGHSPLGG